MIERIIEPHIVPLVGALTVNRVLPRGGRGVGPFFFLDHFGPWMHEPGSSALDVPPHPHTGLSTLTYLFEGEILHRDSLGNVQPILPGEVNWMTAGKGVVHSERVPLERSGERFQVQGLQAWVALPESHETIDPWFSHHDHASVPRWAAEGVSYALLAGEALGRQSPVQCYSRLFYLMIEAEVGRRIEFDPEGQEACFYLLSGEVTVDGQKIRGPSLIIFKPGTSVAIASESPVRGAFLGGENIGPRHMEWNFVSSSRERIEQAKRDWREQKFQKIPGETEWIPLPG